MSFNLFSKQPRKPKKASDSEEGVQTDQPRSKSPLKKSYSRSSKGREEENIKSEEKQQHSASTRSSRIRPKSGAYPSRNSFDPNTTHPLNLPPEQLRRLSTQVRMSEPMDIDVDASSSARNPSPPPVTSPQSSTQQSTPKPAEPVPKPASKSAPKPGPLPSAAANGQNAPVDGDGPPPPPPAHKSNPTSPQAVVPPAPEEAEAFKDAGNRYYKAKQYKKAIEEYSKAVEAMPSSSTYINNRAAAYMAAGQYYQALEDSKRADQLDPNNHKVLLRLARIYISMGLPQEAMDTFGRIQPPPSAKDMAPAKAMLQHLASAADALRNGTGSMAIHSIEQAERLLGMGVPKPRKWQLMRGEAYLKMGNVNALGDAQNVAMSLLRSNSQDPEALVLRGRALYSQGENEKAIQHFRQALTCDPDYRDAVKYLRLVRKVDQLKTEGNAEFKAGRYTEAIAKYSEALKLDPTNRGTNSKLLQNRALCKSRLKDYAAAIEDCDQALQLDPSYTKAKKTKATALGESGQWEDAVRELKQLQEQEPQDASIAKEVRRAELELKKSKRKDYYKILGVEKDADENQIKKAYRKAAIIHHPDKNRDDPHAEERFKDIGEAYETLSNPEKRARYDSGVDLEDPMDGFGGGMGGGGGMNIDPEILMQMFGAQMGGGRGGGGGFHSFGGGMPQGGRTRGAPQGFPGGGFSFQ
ncbi:hypothetical protein DSL72_000118 [Monilinia vaccinii-corymbosi]|uniref:J domain-containing protein n=1 Tax=Monilinia vaccinii-corymbosi TaxID=61207 RepID=A0A8A3P0U2_9HELO|nr:hypothetical protein DSL72_000118 [Monilinia vaccinii-corymbosi]